MISTEFSAEIERAAPDANITAILFWRMAPTEGSVPAHLMETFARIKKPILDQLSAIRNARVNPLLGFPQAIVVAPAEDWRTFILMNPWLRETNQVELIANSEAFHTTARSA